MPDHKMLDQLKDMMDKGSAAEQLTTELSRVSTELSQIAYTINCIWAYTQSSNPTKETLAALAPPMVAHPAQSKDALEYVRKTLIAARSLVTEKINDLATRDGEIKAAQTMMAQFFEQSGGYKAIEPLQPDEISDLAEEFAPVSLRPKSDKPKHSDNAIKSRKVRRPYMWT